MSRHCLLLLILKYIYTYAHFPLYLSSFLSLLLFWHLNFTGVHQSMSYFEANTSAHAFYSCFSWLSSSLFSHLIFCNCSCSIRHHKQQQHFRICQCFVCLQYVLKDFFLCQFKIQFSGKYWFVFEQGQNSCDLKGFHVKP